MAQVAMRKSRAEEEKLKIYGHESVGARGHRYDLD